MRGGTAYGCATRANRGRDQCGFAGMVNRKGLEAAVLYAVKERLFRPEVMQEAFRSARQDLKRRTSEARASARRDNGAGRLKRLDREIENLVAAIKAGGNSGGAALLRKELDRATTERERLAAPAFGDGGFDEKALEAMLAEVPRVVEEVFSEDLDALAEAGQVTQAREALAGLVSEIEVAPAQDEEGRPCFAVAIRGDLSAAFRLLARKRKVASKLGSGGLLRSHS